eukprot:4703564-Pleurochrysis_carterae.AAC.1
MSSRINIVISNLSQYPFGSHHCDLARSWYQNTHRDAVLLTRSTYSIVFPLPHKGMNHAGTQSLAHLGDARTQADEVLLCACPCHVGGDDARDDAAASRAARHAQQRPRDEAAARRAHVPLAGTCSARWTERKACACARTHKLTGLGAGDGEGGAGEGGR